MSVPLRAAFAFPALGVQARIETQLGGSATVESLCISVRVCLLPCKQSRVGDGSATECLACKHEDLSLVVPVVKEPGLLAVPALGGQRQWILRQGEVQEMNFID